MSSPRSRRRRVSPRTTVSARWPRSMGRHPLGEDSPREDLFFAIERGSRTQCAVRRGPWKLVREIDAGGKTADALFNLDDDPNETTDVAAGTLRRRRISRARSIHGALCIERRCASDIGSARRVEGAGVVGGGGR